MKILILIGVFALGALLHEADIQRVCTEKGSTGHAAWFGEFDCKAK